MSDSETKKKKKKKAEGAFNYPTNHGKCHSPTGLVRIVQVKYHGSPERVQDILDLWLTRAVHIRGEVVGGGGGGGILHLRV